VERTSRRWDSFYPTDGLGEDTRRLLGRLVASIPEFLRVLLNHQPAALRGRSLMEVMAVQDRQPAQLGAHYQRWRSHPPQMYRAQPSLVFAALGQARADGRLSPEQESTILAQLLTQWALHSALDTSALRATLPTMRPSAPVT
jgi:hypothetical protein